MNSGFTRSVTNAPQIPDTEPILIKESSVSSQPVPALLTNTCNSPSRSLSSLTNEPISAMLFIVAW